MTTSTSALRRFCLALTLLSASFSARSQTIAIDHYDINDAVLSGHGNWHHSYNGTITPGSGFVNFIPGTSANYFGGSGTLNDGVTGGSVDNSQLFVTSASDGTTLNPTIFLTLDFSTPAANQYWAVNTIEIFGGNIGDNAIPGAITSVDVGIIGPTGGAAATPFATADFGPGINMNGLVVNDLIDLSSTPLSSLPVWTLVLSNFQGTVGNWFSITEINVSGELVTASAVPAPATAWLMSTALLMLFYAGSSRRESSSRCLVPL